MVLLVTPIDRGAPKWAADHPAPGDGHTRFVGQRGFCVVLKETQLEDYLNSSGARPALVITDSSSLRSGKQTIAASYSPEQFQHCFCTIASPFEDYTVKLYLDKLQDGDRVLIREACTHLPSCQT